MPDRACCFVCGAKISDFDPTWAFAMEELIQEHEEDCLWAGMLHDMDLYAEGSQITSFAVLPPANSQPSVDTHINI